MAEQPLSLVSKGLELLPYIPYEFLFIWSFRIDPLASDMDLIASYTQHESFVTDLHAPAMTHGHFRASQLSVSDYKAVDHAGVADTFDAWCLDTSDEGFRVIDQFKARVAPLLAGDSFFLLDAPGDCEEFIRTTRKRGWEPDPDDLFDEFEAHICAGWIEAVVVNREAETLVAVAASGD